MHKQDQRWTERDQWVLDCSNARCLSNKKVLVAIDVSRSVQRSDPRIPVRLGEFTAKVAELCGNTQIVGFDWLGFWDTRQDLLYTKNPHGDFKPASLKQINGTYQYTDQVHKDKLAHWATSFGAPRSNLCLPFNWAEEKRIKFDVFIFLTDQKAIINAIPDDAWGQYAGAVGIQPRVANLCLGLKRYYQDNNGRRFDRLWETPYFSNYTIDTISEMWRFLGG